MRQGSKWKAAGVSPVCSLAAALALASCGGGGGSGPPGAPLGTGGGGTAAPAPAPSPSELPPAPFGIAANTPFALVGYQTIGQDAVFAMADKGTLAWSADLKTYAMTLSDLGSGRLVYTFPGNNPAAFSLIRADGTKADVYVTLIPRTQAIGEVYWQSADGIQPFVYAHGFFGVAPAPGGLPAAGRRIFVTDTATQSALVFDFTARQVSGGLTMVRDNGWDPAGPKETATLEPAALNPDGSFTARFTVAGTTIPGELRGRLMGAQGNELALYWNGPARLGYADSPFETYRTVMSYLVCTSCTG